LRNVWKKPDGKEGSKTDPPRGVLERDVSVDELPVGIAPNFNTQQQQQQQQQQQTHTHTQYSHQ
jgi:hypothetical protein